MKTYDNFLKKHSEFQRILEEVNESSVPKNDKLIDKIKELDKKIKNNPFKTEEDKKELYKDAKHLLNLTNIIVKKIKDKIR